jgi:hypothetical protein
MRRVRLAAAVVVGVAVLAGCSDDGTANETLPSTTSSAAETTESLPPLGPPDFPVPDEARQQTPEGAKAFTGYYLDLSDYLLASLNSQPLRALSEGCEVCLELADGYDADRAAGYSYEGGDVSVTSTGNVTVDGGVAEISYLLHQEPVTVRNESGETITERSSGAYDLSGGMTLRWDSSQDCWIVTQLAAERLS